MTISVSQLNNYIRGLLDMDGILSDLSVCGEVTNLKKARDGWYFTLKDEQSAVNCFCYESAFTAEAGSVVAADGQLNYFTRSGSVSLFVRRMISTQNTGASYQRFVELKEKLKKEGLFDDERKREVPHCCKNIGIVTSETGAVIHDISNVALRRQPFSNLILYPVKVQGVGAEDEIVCGIEYFSSADVDVVIVGRGGGSNEDLSVFNSEKVVRAVSKCHKPVVSAVGHGIDFTLCDFAADKRAVTPSEAAEFVTVDCAFLSNKILTVMERMNASVCSRAQTNGDTVKYCVRSIATSVAHRLDACERDIRAIVGQCAQEADSVCKNTAQRLDKAVSKLSTVNPVNVLKRGYAYVNGENGAIKSVNDVDIKSQITLTLCDGTVSAEVISKEKK